MTRWATGDDRHEMILGLVQEEMAGVLGVAAEQIELDLGFFELGMDSKMAVEFGQRLQTAIGRELPMTVLFDYPNAVSLAAHLSELMATAPAAPSPITEPTPIAQPEPPAEGDLSRLLGQEIEAARAVRNARRDDK